jgi:hypothetical protein
MEKASSNPLRKTTINTSKPIIPIAVSLIFPPDNFDDIAKQHYAFKETTNPNSIEHRVKWYMTGGGYLASLGQIHAKDYEIQPMRTNNPFPNILLLYENPPCCRWEYFNKEIDLIWPLTT